MKTALGCAGAAPADFANANLRSSPPLPDDTNTIQSSPMIVAITGANGFIGQHLVRRFGQEGWTVRPVVRRDVAEDHVRQRFDGADVVIHAAGATRAPTPTGLHDSNVALTEKMVEAADRSGVRRFVFISSLAAVGPAASQEQPITEETVESPVEAYGRT